MANYWTQFLIAVCIRILTLYPRIFLSWKKCKFRIDFFSKSQNVISIVSARSDTDYESLVLVYPFNEAVENSVYICYLHRKLQTVMSELLTIGKEKIRKTNLYLNTASFHDCMFKSFVSNWAWRIEPTLQIFYILLKQREVWLKVAPARALKRLPFRFFFFLKIHLGQLKFSHDSV